MIVCPICLVNFTPDNEPASLKCGHVFHASCIADWFRQKRECPHCRVRHTGAVNRLHVQFEGNESDLLLGSNANNNGATTSSAAAAAGPSNPSSTQALNSQLAEAQKKARDTNKELEKTRRVLEIRENSLRTLERSTTNQITTLETQLRDVNEQLRLRAAELRGKQQQTDALELLLADAKRQRTRIEDESKLLKSHMNELTEELSKFDTFKSVLAIRGMDVSQKTEEYTRLGQEKGLELLVQYCLVSDAEFTAEINKHKTLATETIGLRKQVEALERRLKNGGQSEESEAPAERVDSGTSHFYANDCVMRSESEETSLPEPAQDSFTSTTAGVTASHKCPNRSPATCNGGDSVEVIDLLDSDDDEVSAIPTKRARSSSPVLLD